MILLCGIPSEPALDLVRRRLVQAGADPVLLNQRQVGEMHIEVDVTAGRVTGSLRIADRVHRLEDLTAVYSRLMDHRFLPESKDAAPDDERLQHSARVHDALVQWCEATDALVVNRLAAMGSNGSKPYQAQLIAAHGFGVPDTLVSNDPAAVRDFLGAHEAVVYKSISGVRSIVQRFGEAELARLDDIRWCPVQFQEHVPGQDVRVHCVGTEVFATAVQSEAVDYRYASQQGQPAARLHPLDLDAEVAQRCVVLTAALGLEFAGLDLRVTPEGRVFCFEVNPSPAYGYYEMGAGQPISAALASHLLAAA